jgi:hypothetical protein
MKRFGIGFVAGYALGFVVYFVTLVANGVAWPGSGLTGIVLGVVLGSVNVARRELSWREYARSITNPSDRQP